MRHFNKSTKLDNVLYDVRGPVVDEAARMEQSGMHVLKLNIGNPAPFGFEAPDVIMRDMIAALPHAQGYSDSKGIVSARRAVVTRYELVEGFPRFDVDDVFLGNGVSELITMTLQALLDNGDQVLIPAPDYPLWTASTALAGGTPVHYLCDETQGWNPDIADLESKITDRTKAIVVINPNNPTGAVYPEPVLLEIAAVAREFGLIVYADEIYDKVLFDGTRHTSIASLAPDLFCVTFNGLSKNYRAAGYRAGWMILSGDKSRASDYIEGLTMLSSMRLCANVPAQYGIQTALGGYQSINDLLAPTGRLTRQRDLAVQMLNDMPGVSCVKPKGALYCFPRLDPKLYPVQNDQQFILELLTEQRVLLVQGTGFNWPGNDHFRVVFLPHMEDLEEALDRVGRFLEGYRRRFTA